MRRQIEVEDHAGRHQIMLVLGALASRDFAIAEAFKDTVLKGREEMYDDGYDYTKFTDRAKLALTRAGFDPVFIDSIEWTNFTEEVWTALKTLHEKLQLVVRYEGTDCPCITALVAQARCLEVKNLVKVAGMF